MQRLVVDQHTITQTTLETCAPQPLKDGQIRLRVHSFALTANNVTYAATGFQIGYWEFFPTGTKGKGIVPVWGTAEVTESRMDGIAPGARYYGYYPMASELVITPRISASGTVEDIAPHRAKLPGVYNRYVPVPDPAQDHMRALLQPLLATSWLLSDWLADNAFFGAQQVIVGSASSKTGLGLCKYLAEDSGRDCQIVGLTSAGNKAFVEGLGACDAVMTYDAVDALAQKPSVYVDMSGNAGVKQQVHSTLGDHLKHSAAVGISHWDKFAPPTDLPGVKPQFFFAPAQIAKRREDWGPGAVEREINAAWLRVAQTASGWLEVKVHAGLAAAEQVYAELAEGRANPRDGHVITL